MAVITPFRALRPVAEKAAQVASPPYDVVNTEEARGLAKADHDMAYWMTSASALLGEKDEAFYWLERAIKLGNENRPWFEVDKCLASLRDDPRFDELMKKIEAGRAQ